MRSFIIGIRLWPPVVNRKNNFLYPIQNNFSMLIINESTGSHKPAINALFS